eukprot:624459-Karenia_brevis.AAC.1
MMESLSSRSTTFWKADLLLDIARILKLRDKGEEEGALISGVRVMHHKDYSFTWHMGAYVHDKL